MKFTFAEILTEEEIYRELKRRQKEKENMTLNKYQEKAIKTAIYGEGNSVIYPALGLAGEAGEVSNKVKKILRDGNTWDEETRIQKYEDIRSEIGDCLWYLAALARDLNTDLETVAQENLDKLYSRMERGTISGSGDKR